MQHKADPKAMEKLVRHGWDACLLMREAVEQLDARRSEFVWHIFLHSHIQIESANALMMTYNHNTSVFCVVQEIVPTGWLFILLFLLIYLFPSNFAGVKKIGCSLAFVSFFGAQHLGRAVFLSFLKKMQRSCFRLAPKGVVGFDIIVMFELQLPFVAVIYFPLTITSLATVTTTPPPLQWLRHRYNHGQKAEYVAKQKAADSETDTTAPAPAAVDDGEGSYMSHDHN